MFASGAPIVVPVFFFVWMRVRWKRRKRTEEKKNRRRQISSDGYREEEKENEASLR